MSESGISSRGPRGAAVFAMVVGALALIGWATSWDALTRLGSGFIRMKPLTAAGLVGLGAGLWSLARGSRRAWPWFAASAVLGAVTLAEYATGWNAGIETVLF